MSGVERTGARQVRRYRHCPVGDVDVAEGAVEDRQRALRLIIGHFVTALVHTAEAEVAVLSDLAILHAVVNDRLVAGCGELGFVGVVQGQAAGASV